MSQAQRHKVLITSGAHAGREGVVVARDPKWVQVRIAVPGWPFPRTEWLHRREFVDVAPDPLAGIEEALV